jgi:hypothetical protein
MDFDTVLIDADISDDLWEAVGGYFPDADENAD